MTADALRDRIAAAWSDHETGALHPEGYVPCACGQRFTSPQALARHRASVMLAVLADADPVADLEHAMAVIEHLQAENERLRAELRTVTERSEAMKARCKKAIALWRGENERLREALRAAGLAPSVVAAIAKGEPPRPCPAGHGDQCCGYPAACEAALSGRKEDDSDG